MKISEITFNREVSLLTCVSVNQTILYKLPNAIERFIETEFNGEIGKGCHLKKSNLCLVVSAGKMPFRATNTVVLWDCKIKEMITEITMKEEIKKVAITEKDIIIVLKKKIYVYSHSAEMKYELDTFTNNNGVCTIIDKPELTIACLGKNKGDITIWKPYTKYQKTTRAHRGKVTVIALSIDGQMVASASENGTILNIYNTNNMELIHELRRGTSVTSPAQIYDIAFNQSLDKIVCCSSNGTVHIFELTKKKDNPNTKSMLYFAKNWLPKYFSSEWSCKKLYTGTNSKMICGFDKKNVLHIACYDGNYYRIMGKDFSMMKRTRYFE